MDSISARGGKVLVTKLRESGPQVIEIKGFAELAERQGWDLPDQFPGFNTTISDEEKVAEAIEIDLQNQDQESEIPGKLPANWIGKEATKIAWRIECETNTKAEVQSVIDGLIKLAKSESENKLKTKDGYNGVCWCTSDGNKWNEWGVGACREALRKWNNSRKKDSSETQ